MFTIFSDSFYPVSHIWFVFCKCFHKLSTILTLEEFLKGLSSFILISICRAWLGIDRVIYSKSPGPCKTVLIGIKSAELNDVTQPKCYRLPTNITLIVLNSFPNKPWFLRVYSASLLKTLWEKEKLLVTSNFSFSHSVFYPFGKLFTISIWFIVVVCKLFQFGKSLTFVVWERVTGATWNV